MSHFLIGLAGFVLVTIFVLIIYYKDDCHNYASKYDEKTGKYYPVLNGDPDTATTLVTLPDGTKGWTDGLGNGYIR